MCIYYGDRSNRDLFVYSGFIDPQQHHTATTSSCGRTRYSGPVEGVGVEGEKKAAVAADWSRIRVLMRRKAGVDGAVTVKLPLPLHGEPSGRRRGRGGGSRASGEARTRRQQAWQRVGAG